MDQKLCSEGFFKHLRAGDAGVCGRGLISQKAGALHPLHLGDRACFLQNKEDCTPKTPWSTWGACPISLEAQHLLTAALRLFTSKQIPVTWNICNFQFLVTLLNIPHKQLLERRVMYIGFVSKKNPFMQIRKSISFQKQLWTGGQIWSSVTPAEMYNKSSVLHYLTLVLFSCMMPGDLDTNQLSQTTLVSGFFLKNRPRHHAIASEKWHSTTFFVPLMGLYLEVLSARLVALWSLYYFLL